MDTDDDLLAQLPEEPNTPATPVATAKAKVAAEELEPAKELIPKSSEEDIEYGNALEEAIEDETVKE